MLLSQNNFALLPWRMHRVPAVPLSLFHRTPWDKKKRHVRKPKISTVTEGRKKKGSASKEAQEREREKACDYQSHEKGKCSTVNKEFPIC